MSDTATTAPDTAVTGTHPDATSTARGRAGRVVRAVLDALTGSRPGQVEARRARWDRHRQA